MEYTQPQDTYTTLAKKYMQANQAHVFIRLTYHVMCTCSHTEEHTASHTYPHMDDTPHHILAHT